MPETTDALVETIRFEAATPQCIVFRVEAPPNLPETFDKQTDRDELNRLRRLTGSSSVDDAHDIGRVPVRYDDDEWEIAWGELKR